MTRTLSAPGLIEQPVSVTRQMASALPGLQAMAKEKGLKVHHLGAGYPHPEVSDPTDYIARRSAFFDHLASGRPLPRSMGLTSALKSILTSSSPPLARRAVLP